MAKVPTNRSSCVSRYLREISEYPLLTKEQEHAIAKRILESKRRRSTLKRGRQRKGPDDG